MKDVEIKKATSADLADFYGSDYAGKLEAWTAWYKGERVAIAGVRFDEHGPIVFSDHKPVEAPRMTSFKACKALMAEISKTQQRVITVCFPERSELREPERKAARFLELMGFRYSHWDDNSFAVFELVPQ